jgi:formyl-CoA transferase
VAAPFLFEGTRAAPTLPPPALGEHTVQALREAGLDRREIRALLASGAAFQASSPL